jgi:hypothetical protein
MKIVETYSYFNGLEFLNVRKPALWKEIRLVVACVDAETCRRKKTTRTAKNGRLCYSPVALRNAFKEQLLLNKWNDFIKDRVAVAVQFGKYSFVAYDLFVNHLAFYIGDKIDVGIEILPMKLLQMQMGSGVPNYEGELYNVVRQGRSIPVVPLVIVGIEP